MTSPPSRLIISTTSSLSRMRRAAKTTFAPAFANAMAVALPIPELAPVTSTTGLVECSDIGYLLWICKRIFTRLLILMLYSGVFSKWRTSCFLSKGCSQPPTHEGCCIRHMGFALKEVGNDLYAFVLSASQHVSHLVHIGNHRSLLVARD